MKKFITSAVLLLVSLTGALIFIMFYTSIGINISIGLISRLTTYQVSAEQSSGRLSGSWELQKLHIRSAELEVFIDRLSADWHPAALLQKTLHIGSLQAEAVEVILAEAQSEPVSRSGPVSLPDISLPLAIELNQFLLQDLSIYRTGQGRLLQLESITTEAALRNSLVSITTLDVEQPHYWASLKGSVVMAGNWTAELDGSWTFSKDGCADVEGAFGLSGSPDEMAVSLSTTAPGAVAVEGTLFRLLDTPGWELDGTADLFLPDLCNALAPLDGAVTFHSAGNPADYRLQLTTELEYPELPKIEGSLFISGNEGGLVVDRSSTRFDNNELELTGQFNWKNDVDWSFSLSTQSFDVSHYQDFAGGSIDLLLNSTGSLADGQLRYNGTISDLRIVAEEPALSLNGAVEFQGNDREIEILAAHLKAGEALLQLDGRFGWSTDLRWQASGRFEQVNPAQWGAFPVGRIQGEVHTHGTIVENGIQAEATLASLTGTFAGYPVEGGGSIDYLPDELKIRELFLLSGPNSLSIDGTIGTSVDVQFSVDGQNLKHLHERLAGRLEISGSILGERQSPYIDLLARAYEFSYDDYRLHALDASAVFDQQELELSLEIDRLQRLSVPVEELADKLDVSISGNVEDHIFSVELLSGFGNLAVRGSGQIIDMAGWSGTLKDLAYDHPLYGLWQLQEPAGVALAAETASIDGFCLAATAGAACADGLWSLEDGWQADISSLHFDTSSLERWNLLTFPLRGKLRGELHAAGNGTAVHVGSAHLFSEKLYLEDSADAYLDPLIFTDTALTIDLEDQLLQTSLRSMINDGSSLAMNVAIDTFGDPSVPFPDLPLDGALSVRIEDLSRLAALTGDVVVPEGRISADFAVGGVLGNPDLLGWMKLEDGGLMLPDYGLHLQEIAAQLQGDRQGLEVNLTTRSGEGRGTVNGNIRFIDKSWAADLDISGQNLQLWDQRELRITGNPKLNLFISPEGGNLSGTILIPQARIEPEEMTGSDTMSRDTQFTDESASDNEFPFDLNVAIELGDDIQVKGFGFEGSLAGAMDLVRAGGGEIRGRGQIQVENGTVSFMGRTIEISRGILLFTGNPIDNPALDIQARKIISREQAGKSDMVVGLNITGSVQDYYVELFSDPMMEEREIIAALLLGRPLSPGDNTGLVDSAIRFMGISGGNNILGQVGEKLQIGTFNLKKDSDQGNVSLSFNRQLTDRLSAGYDVNLFDNQGLFRVRYSLPRGFSLEVRNSVDVTGVELLYNFVR